MDRDRAEPSVDEFPGQKSKDWVNYHRKFASPSTYAYGFVWDFTEEADGPFCRDPSGNTLIDFTGHVAAAPLGYNNSKLQEKLEAFPTIDPTKIAGQDFYASGGGTPDDPDFPGPSQLMDRLTDITSHYDMDTVFLSNTGAEAVENGIKVCYDSSDGAKHGITFRGAFHGRTLGALSLNRSKGTHRRDFPEIPGIHDVPYCTHEPENCTCGFFPSGDEDDSLLRRYLDEAGSVAPNDVAYIILEPIQGEGGYRMPSDAFMQEVNEVSDEYDIPIVADEIQAGLGRTGEMWGIDNYDIEPDVITSAKGLRVGATVGREELFPDESGRLSSTWGAGDLLSSMVGVLTIDTIQEENLMANAEQRGNQLYELVVDGDYDSVEDVRHQGLMFAVEFDTQERRDAVMEAALDEGLLTLPCGHKTLRLLPPLDVREREIELGADLLDTAIQRVED